MASPYQKTESTDKGTSVFRRKSSITLEGIENMFARAENVRDVTAAMIEGLCEQRKIDLASCQSRGRCELYRRYLSHCLEDKRLSKEERADLSHLRDLLHLNQADLSHIHDEVAIEVYGEAVNEVLQDFKLDDEEAAFLADLQRDLGLSEAQADRLYQKGTNMARSRALHQAESRDDQFTLHRQPAGEFTGRSDESLANAIEDGLKNATTAIPGLHWFEVGDISGYIEDGRPKSWHVRLRAGIDKD